MDDRRVDSSDEFNDLDSEQRQVLRQHARRIRQAASPVTHSEFTSVLENFTERLDAQEKRAEERLHLQKSETDTRLRLQKSETDTRLEALSANARRIHHELEPLKAAVAIGGAILVSVLIATLQLSSDVEKLKETKARGSKASRASKKVPPTAAD